MTAAAKRPASPPAPGTPPPAQPALWHERAPRHFDLAVPWWITLLLVALCTLLALWFFDQPLALWASAPGHRIPDLVRAGDPSAAYRGGDAGRELMFLEQWGQGVCSVVVIAGVALLDAKGRRRALAIAIGCIITALVTHLLKDLFGRSRPFNHEVSGWHDGRWLWGGPAMGFGKGASWGSFPSAHTTAAFALAAGLSWFYPRGRALFMGLALITAAQRVLHTAHYLSDVIAGIGLGVLLMRWSLHARLAGRLISGAPTRVREWWLADWGPPGPPA